LILEGFKCEILPLRGCFAIGQKSGLGMTNRSEILPALGMTEPLRSG